MRKATPRRDAVPLVRLTRRLAWFRYQLRQFLRFSERTAREHGVTPLQHQLMLGIAGFTGRGWATISELAEFLQERHNAVVALVQRVERRGLIRKKHNRKDQRVVLVSLTPKGARILHSLTRLHRRELERFEGGHFIVSKLRPTIVGQKKGGPVGQRAHPIEQ